MMSKTIPYLTYLIRMCMWFKSKWNVKLFFYKKTIFTVIIIDKYLFLATNIVCFYDCYIIHICVIHLASAIQNLYFHSDDATL